MHTGNERNTWADLGQADYPSLNFVRERGLVLIDHVLGRLKYRDGSLQWACEERARRDDRSAGLIGIISWIMGDNEMKRQAPDLLFVASRMVICTTQLTFSHFAALYFTISTRQCADRAPQKKASGLVRAARTPGACFPSDRHFATNLGDGSGRS